MSILHKLEWRYATKKFNPDRIVAENDITEILKAVNLSASSSGLQPYEVIVVHNKSLQENLQKASYMQPQILDASHVVIFAAKKSITPEYIDEYIERTESIRGLDSGSLDGYNQSIQNMFKNMSSSEMLIWSQKQAYIALGTLLIAAADLKIDACPMEGFEPDKYDEILGLGGRGLHATVIASIGYRSHEDKLATAKKSRKNLDDLVHLEY